MKQTATVGVVCALPIEACTLTHYRPEIGQTVVVNEKLLVHVSGMGENQARIGAQKLIEKGASALISWGTAGGLQVALGHGQLLLPNQVIHHDKSVFTVDSVLQSQLQIYMQNHIVVNQGTLLQMNRIVTSVADKFQLFNQYQACAVDMESAAIAAVAQAACAKFLVVRSIVDSAHMNFPHWLQNSLSAFGEVQPWSLLRKCFQPVRISELARIAHSFNAARQTLRKAGVFLHRYLSSSFI
ncbi:MAG: hypothetical protein JSR33_01290 [Proteobacteria bacterium]|nr:hypothetical protein [Pseudomonadota bacterium]